MQHQDAVAEVLGLAHDVSREEDGAAGLLLGPNGLDDEMAADDVERSGGLVEDQQIGFMQERASDVGALFLPRRKRAAGLTGEGAHLQARDHFVNPPAEPRLVHTVEAAKIP